MFRFCIGLACVMMVAGAAYASGEVTLVDASGLEFWINTNITSSTSSSASGAASDATGTTAVSGVTTTGGATVTTTLTDAFDGYNGIFVKVDDGEFVSYNNNGTATQADAHRTLVFKTQTIDEIDVHRKVFVPVNDEFCRWLNFFTNTGTTTKTIVLQTSNNLGSDDENTKVHSTSSGDAIATTADNWVVTFEDPRNFNPPSNLSTDPRLGHVLQGPGGSVSLSSITFADFDGFPWWEYTFDLAPGETAIIMNFVTGQPSLADAEDKAAALANLEGAAIDFISDTEAGQILNFAINQNTQYTVTFEADGTPGATLTGTTPQTVDQGSDCTAVTANAPANQHFVRWTKGGAAYSTGNPLTVTNVTETMTLVANFAINQHTVTFETDGTPGATLTGTTPQTVDQGSDCTAVTANAPANQHFVKWTKGGLDFSTSNPLIVTNVTETMTLVANFAMNHTGCSGGALTDSAACPPFSRLGGDALMLTLVGLALAAISRAPRRKDNP